MEIFSLFLFVIIVKYFFKKGTAATKSIENNIKIRINEAEDKLKIKMDKIKTKIIEELKNIDAKFLEILHKEKKKINKFIRLKIEKIILKILTDKARPLLKKKLKDPEMCKSVQHFIDDLVDELFPGIIEEVQLKLR